MYLEFTSSTDEMILRGEEMLKRNGLLYPPVAGVTPMKGATNMLRVSEIT